MNDTLQISDRIYEPKGWLNPAIDEKHFTFHTYIPPDPLKPFVHHFWIIQWNRSDSEPYVSEQVLHRPYVDVYVSRQESGIQCTYRGRRDYAAIGSGRIIGARLLPGAFHAFWRRSLSDLPNLMLALQDVLPGADQAWIEQALAMPDGRAAAALAALVQGRNPQMDSNIQLVNTIIGAIEANDIRTVSEAAVMFGRSERWLQQLFRDYVGIGLKWQLQRYKLLEAARLIRESDNPQWAFLAYDTGYSSQQHFITDFKRVLGRTPLQYWKRVAESRS